MLICFFFVCFGVFHPYGDVTIASEGLQILTYARHSWPLSSECSLACHTYGDTGHPFIMVISKDPWHSHLLPSVCQWSSHSLFYDLLGLSRPGIDPDLLMLKENCTLIIVTGGDLNHIHIMVWSQLEFWNSRSHSETWQISLMTDEMEIIAFHVHVITKFNILYRTVVFSRSFEVWFRVQ